MAMLIDTPPDKIVQRSNGQYLFIYAHGQDTDLLPIGAQYLIVYSPTIHLSRWRVVRYGVVMGPGTSTALEVGGVRSLTDEEVAHFEGLIARR